MALETITVYYIPNQINNDGRWYIKDYFGEVLNSFSKKKQAKRAAKRFAKDRAKASGSTVKLKIFDTRDDLSEVKKFNP